MNNENFEVVFAGKLVPGAELEQVKAKVAAIFKTDAAKVAHLFSGNAVVIKKGIDQAMAQKYLAAMQSAGAVCEIRDASQAAPVVAEVAAQPAVRPAPAKKAPTSNARPAPQTAPLRVTADSITAIQASLAPLGSDLSQFKQSVQAEIPDISGLSIAPAGTLLATPKKVAAEPIADISGLSIVKN